MSFEPKHATRFFDQASGREMMLNLDEGGWHGWLFYRHPGGQWVSLRKATEDDLRRLNRAVAEVHHRD